MHIFLKLNAKRLISFLNILNGITPISYQILPFKSMFVTLGFLSTTFGFQILPQKIITRFEVWEVY